MQLQRTILWIVFSMSLLFLWDSWQRHNGKPSLLMGMSGQSETKAGAKGAPPPAPGAAAKSDASVPAAPGAVPAAPGAAAAAPTGGTAVPASPAAALIKLRSDTLALEVDPVGGQIRRAELLKHKAGSETIGRNSGHVVLLHDDHSHPGITGTGSSLTLPIATTGHGWEGNTRYQVTLTATDGNGLIHTGGERNVTVDGAQNETVDGEPIKDDPIVRQRIAQLGTDQVLSTVATREAEVAGAHLLAVGQPGDQAGVLVIGMRHDVEHAAQHVELLHAVQDLGGVGLCGRALGEDEGTLVHV